MLLQFLTAERCGDWERHLSTTAAMIPHFFALDRPNYSKWLPDLSDMRRLPENHPLVYQEFQNGNHSITRTGSRTINKQGLKNQWRGHRYNKGARPP